MTGYDLETCPGCGARLPVSNGPIHRYLGASAACWAIYTSLSNAGVPALTPAPLNALLVDAYAVQHPGTPSDQTIQSAAVHLLALYGVLDRHEPPEKALWIRQRAVRPGYPPKHTRFNWLEPASFEGCLTVAEIVRAPAAPKRTELVGQYVLDVWSRWKKPYAETIAAWYECYILIERV